MKVAVVEDNAQERDRLLGCFNQYEQEHSINFEITTYQNGLEFVDHYTKDFDVIYLDVQMPHMDGMTAAKKIRKVDSTVPIVFVTNYVQYAIQGYEVDATDFILKPINYFNFSEHFKKIERKVGQEQASLLFDTLSGSQKIILDQLYYVESEKHYLHLHLMVDGKAVV
ncbi:MULTISPECIES: LytTR family DNA-binding domain-containing protein [Lactobacillus]|uniref:LytR/AlgR family response regulator transcription factor n=1 Tax=Lactobacillus TaxID=1578 RepID=UPI001F1FD2FD|nr:MULTISPECIES: LytTR family DNA-binding domain-containing protein [Lactobacillus]